MSKLTKPTPTVDPLAAALDAAEAPRSGSKLRVDVLFGDRPAVLASIVAAYERGLSAPAIAKKLSSAGEPISEGAVATWLRNNGHLK